MDFAEKLLQAVRRNRSLLCLGLDPDPDLMPQTGIIEFNKAVISSTSDLVCAYKPNLAFYEALGGDGLAALQETVKYIPDKIPVIGDAKRGDVGHTARAYAKALFDVLGFDAVTLNPAGRDSTISPWFIHTFWVFGSSANRPSVSSAFSNVTPYSPDFPTFTLPLTIPAMS